MKVWLKHYQMNALVSVYEECAVFFIFGMRLKMLLIVSYISKSMR